MRIATCTIRARCYFGCAPTLIPLETARLFVTQAIHSTTRPLSKTSARTWEATRPESWLARITIGRGRSCLKWMNACRPLSIRCKKKRVDLAREINPKTPAELRLRTPKELPGVNVTRESARRNATQIVRASGVGAAVDPAHSGIARKWISTRRNRPISPCAILGNGMTNQGPGRRAGGGTDGRAADI